MNAKLVLATGFLGIALLGCKPAGPAPDLIQTQREGLNQAKAVEGQLQQAAQEKMKAADESGK
ncbi:MAG: hypothetical protein V4632_22145 [Pseudomonadota bacterium]